MVQPGLARRYGTFGTIGAAWIFSREGWFGKNSVLSFGKLRGSYGITGNDQYVRNLSRGLMYGGCLYVKNGIQPGRLDYSPSYSWERIRKAEAAVDLGFIEWSVFWPLLCYYNNRSTDQLLTGRFQTIARNPSKDVYIPVNVPAVVENKGFEIDVEGVVFRNSSITWSTNLNLSFPKNRLVYFPYFDRSNYKNFFSEGMSLDVLMGLHLKEVDPQTGVYQFEDSGDDGLTLDDSKFGKELGPFFYGGLYNNVRYNNFEISCLFRYTKQNNYSLSICSLTRYMHQVSGMNNQPVAVLNKWKESGDPCSGTKIYRCVRHRRSNCIWISTGKRWYAADRCKLPEVTIPFACLSPAGKKLLKTKIKSCKLYIQASTFYIQQV